MIINKSRKNSNLELIQRKAKGETKAIDPTRVLESLEMAVTKSRN